MPHRVFHQFGLFQTHPSEWQDTDKALHRLDRRRQRKIKDWDKHHKKYVTMFKLSVEQARATALTQRAVACGFEAKEVSPMLHYAVNLAPSDVKAKGEGWESMVAEMGNTGYASTGLCGGRFMPRLSSFATSMSTVVI